MHMCLKIIRNVDLCINIKWLDEFEVEKLKFLIWIEMVSQNKSVIIYDKMILLKIPKFC